MVQPSVLHRVTLFSPVFAGCITEKIKLAMETENKIRRYEIQVHEDQDPGKTDQDPYLEGEQDPDLGGEPDPGPGPGPGPILGHGPEGTGRGPHHGPPGAGPDPDPGPDPEGGGQTGTGGDGTPPKRETEATNFPTGGPRSG